MYCEIDPTIKVTPFVKIRFDKAVNLMKNYTANPGYAVTIIRKTQEYINNERISVETMRRINELLDKITAENVKNIDKTLTGFVIYEMVLYAVKYYEAMAKDKYNFDVFSKEICDSKTKELRLSEKSIGILQSDNFGIVLQTERLNGGRSVSSESESEVKPVKKVSTNSITKNPFSSRLELSQTERVLNHDLLPKKTPSPSKVPMTRASLHPSSPSKFTPKNAFKNSPQKKAAPLQSNSTKPTTPIPVKKPSKSIDINIISGKKLLANAAVKKSLNKEVIPKKKSASVDLPYDSKNIDHRDILEEMQYQQFIEEKFRHFLVDKLNQVSENNSEVREKKLKNEEKAMKNRENWMKEFEDKVGIIRFNAIKKLGDEKRFTAELIRAQRQLDLLEKFG